MGCGDRHKRHGNRTKRHPAKVPECSALTGGRHQGGHLHIHTRVMDMQGHGQRSAARGPRHIVHLRHVVRAKRQHKTVILAERRVKNGQPNHHKTGDQMV